MRNLLFLVLTSLLFSSCVQNKKAEPLQNQTSSNEKSFEVEEVIQTSKYTYILANENNTERWVAATRIDAKKGEKYYYDSALEMNNFKSKELDRTFESVFFLNRVSKNPISAHSGMSGMPGMPGMSMHSDKAKVKEGGDIEMEKTDNELTIADVFANKTDFANKTIEIRGKVVKVNKQIMGKNWIHLQDGTQHENSFDLTVTSQDLPAVGDEVTFKGTLVLEKDFGAGYFYDVIMENGEMTSKIETTTI
jgi:hypothetical protein